MRSIKELENLEGKRVLVRVDWNVRVKDGQVLDDFRIRKSLPTLEFLKSRGANIIVALHLEPVSTSIEPFKKYLPEGAELLENLRLNPGEETNDEEFAKSLADRADIYVNEAFSVSHRTHASIVGVPKFLPSFMGLQFEEEVKNLSSTLESPERPFLFILGGAKFSTKMPLIKKYLDLADNVFIGGALSNDFLKAKGFGVGLSLVDGESVGMEEILKNSKLILPQDLVVESGEKLATRKVDEVGKNEVIIDLGAESVQTIAPYIERAKLILWNGPLGKYETGGDKATKEILKLIGLSSAKSIIGGGDTVALISELGMEDKFSFVSTGGGATLDFLANGTLPGIKALQ